MDKEWDKLNELLQEYLAMKELKADEDALKKQIQKIKRQEKKIEKLSETCPDEQK